MKNYRIIKNAIRCKKCGEEIESKTVHDFKWCSCHACAVDGGHDYLRRLGEPQDWESISICEEIENEDKIPNWKEAFTYSDVFPSLVYENGYECKSYGYLTYKGCVYPVYDDDYGCQEFIIYRYYDKEGKPQEYFMPVRNIAGELDWWYELDRIKESYPNEIKYIIPDQNE